MFRRVVHRALIRWWRCAANESGAVGEDHAANSGQSCLAGAKARIDLMTFAARLKSCPDTVQRFERQRFEGVFPQPAKGLESVLGNSFRAWNQRRADPFLITKQQVRL